MLCSVHTRMGRAIILFSVEIPGAVVPLVWEPPFRQDLSEVMFCNRKVKGEVMLCSADIRMGSVITECCGRDTVFWW